AAMAPGVGLTGDFAGSVANLLPRGGGGAPQVFAPLASRVFSALAPLGGGLAARAMDFRGDTLILDFEAGDPTLAARLRAALAGARVQAIVAESPDGTIRVTARP